MHDTLCCGSECCEVSLLLFRNKAQFCKKFCTFLFPWLEHVGLLPPVHFVNSLLITACRDRSQITVVASTVSLERKVHRKISPALRTSPGLVLVDVRIHISEAKDRQGSWGASQGISSPVDVSRKLLGEFSEGRSCSRGSEVGCSFQMGFIQSM